MSYISPFSRVFFLKLETDFLTSGMDDELDEIENDGSSSGSSDTLTIHKDSKYSLDSKIGEILKAQEAIDAIESIVPGIITHPQAKYFKSMTLRKAAKMLPDMLSSEILVRIEDALSKIEG